MDRSETFTHHGHAFVIEADGWPAEENQEAAILDLQLWAMQLGVAETAALHAALEMEREALVQEMTYERNAPPLPAVRMAQRHAVRTGLQGRRIDGMLPTVTIEVYQVSIAPDKSGG
jgi:hypothetical protein